MSIGVDGCVSGLRCLSEALARRANKEDECSGPVSCVNPPGGHSALHTLRCAPGTSRWSAPSPRCRAAWERLFKCQRLLDEGAILACMAYVDLNPVRASVVDSNTH
jgi:hypothetical protein